MNYKWIEEYGIKWITDDNGNRCSVDYFGSEEAAETALKSLEDCKNCVNCSGCSDCSDCSGCSGCSDCSDCSGCSGCSRCSHCSRCSRCSDCSDCSDCSGCSRCSGCSGCSRCSRCSGCWRCSDCSDCSDCSGCSHVANLYEKKGAHGDPDNKQVGAPTIPVIQDIHKKVYEAVSQPKALDMGSWHSCETTHCRAGWVVHLAGESGYALEKFHNTPLAAQLIYSASGYEINPCRFYDPNNAAMEDMKKLAEG